MKKITRGDFLKLSAASLGSLALRPWARFLATGHPSGVREFPEYERLGRVIGGKVPVKALPDIDSQEIGVLFEDDVVPWLREVVGKRPLWNTQRFVDTGDGYVYAPNLQPVINQLNEALRVLPSTDGLWMEITVPYVDLVLDNPPARSPWLKLGLTPRLYYSQVFWVDGIKTDEQGQSWYRVKEKYGTFGDIFWVPAEVMRPISAEEIAPISPGVEDKHVEVDLTYQTLSCFEGQTEVYFCRISTGGKFDKDGNPSEKWSTPVGPHSIWRKLVSVHMTGGTTGGGYDLPGIGWTSLFSGDGVAIHSTFWHNSFGTIMSHGCVNARPEDAKWVFRWTHPDVPYHAGDVIISGTGSTRVVVVES
jgi:hypothetical protein